MKKNWFQDKVLPIQHAVSTPALCYLVSGDDTIYTIRQTVLEYLPETLENYLNLPRAYVSLHSIKNG